MRSMLTVVCVATALATGMVLVSPLIAAPPDDTVAPADSTNRSSDNESVYSWEYVSRHARSLIGVQYGFGDVDREGFGGDLAPVGAFDLQIGYRVERRYGGEDGLLHQSSNFALISNLASRLASDLPDASEVGTDMWRFGVGGGDGYGYRFASGRGRLVLQNSSTSGWHTLDVEGGALGALPAADVTQLEQFTSHTRFGESWESGVEIGFGNMAALHAGYERMAVFPSFKIWYWLLSTGFDRAALLGMDLFMDGVEDSSPYAAPVVRFLLEGAVQYAFYELRNEEVNWPFETEPPLAYDMFKLGLTTRF